MPIPLIRPLAVGTALRLFLEPTLGAERWCVLRRADGGFTGHDDPDAAVVFESGFETTFVDTFELRNGTPYFYRLYCLTGGAWVSDGDIVGTPVYSVENETPDALMIVRDRLSDGLNAMIEVGSLAHPHGRIAVLTAPPVFDDTYWPVVTVHIANDASGERGLGEVIDVDRDETDDGLVADREGWLSHVQITIVAWSLNPDERAALRRAISGLVIGNLPVFEALGLQQIDLSQDDTEDFTSFEAPVYQTVSTLRCLAPAVVRSDVAPISDVSLSVVFTPQQARSFGKPYPRLKTFYR